MTMTSAALTCETRRRFALPHDARGGIVPRWDNPTLAGTGGIMSTQADMLAFAAANLAPAGKGLHRAMAMTHRPRRPVRPGTRVGLGWHIYRPLDRDIVWHSGQTGGSHSFAGLDRAHRTAVVILSNSASPVEDIGFHLLDRRVELDAAGPGEVVVAPEILDRYAGVYQLPAGTVTVTHAAGALTAAATGQGVAPMAAVSDTEFVVKIVGAHVTFERNEQGAVTGLVLRQRDHEARGVKLR